MLWKKEITGKKTSTTEYLIVRRVVRNLPKELRRERVTESEIVLAFPINAHGQPLLKSQSTYAYLPINDYGFCVSCAFT